jgi:hypothetical protein
LVKSRLLSLFQHQAPKDSAVLLMLPKEIQQFSVRDFALSPKQDELFITVESNKNIFSSILQLTKDR